MTPEEIATMTPKIHADRVTGSKWVFVSEHSMVLTIWSLKACMLIIYARITYVLLIVFTYYFSASDLLTVDFCF